MKVTLSWRITGCVRRALGREIRLRPSVERRITLRLKFCVARIMGLVLIGGLSVCCSTKCSAAEVRLTSRESKMLSRCRTSASQGSVAAFTRRLSCKQLKTFSFKSFWKKPFAFLDRSASSQLQCWKVSWTRLPLKGSAVNVTTVSWTSWIINSSRQLTGRW